MAPNALTNQAPETPRHEFLNGYFAEQFAAGVKPDYGYPKNHLPTTNLDEIEVVTGYMAAKGGN